MRAIAASTSSSADTSPAPHGFDQADGVEVAQGVVAEGVNTIHAPTVPKRTGLDGRVDRAARRSVGAAHSARRNTAPTVIARIFQSSHSDQFSM